MYESPVRMTIRRVIEDSKNAIESVVCNAAFEMGIEIDKGELLKALTYDRDQYNNGYADGKADATPKWISVKDRLPESGVHVLVCCEIRANGSVIRKYICDGFYVEAWKEKAGCYAEDCALVYCEEDDEYYLEEGWYEVIKNWEEYSSITIADFPTYWMPLPEPPKEEC